MPVMAPSASRCCKRGCRDGIAKSPFYSRITPMDVGHYIYIYGVNWSDACDGNFRRKIDIADDIVR